MNYSIIRYIVFCFVSINDSNILQWATIKGDKKVDIAGLNLKFIHMYKIICLFANMYFLFAIIWLLGKNITSFSIYRIKNSLDYVYLLISLTFRK